MTNQSVLPVIFQTPNPSRLAYALHQALKAIEHLSYAPYLNLVGAYRYRTGNGAVIAEMRSNYIPSDIVPIDSLITEWDEIPDVLVEHKGTPAIRFPELSYLPDSSQLNAIASFFKREVTDTNPLTLKLK